MTHAQAPLTHARLVCASVEAALRVQAPLTHARLVCASAEAALRVQAPLTRARLVCASVEAALRVQVQPLTHARLVGCVGVGVVLLV
jgi:hypothetical protein